MADLYQNIVRQPEKEKKAWKVPVILTAAFLVVVIVVLVIIGPLRQHLLYVNYMSDLSTDTVYAAEHDSLKCLWGEDTIRISGDNAYALYRKLIASERGTPDREIPETPGILLTYGNGSELEIWPCHFEMGRSEGVFIRYASAEGMLYSYRTNHLSYSNLTGILTLEQNEKWDEGGN